MQKKKRIRTRRKKEKMMILHPICRLISVTDSVRKSLQTK